ncbi:MAG: type II toxin-antitoxin system Phd/YefM family antitoxin [Rhodococcus sp. (in: high G+C Gram-positive bacteria)]
MKSISSTEAKAKLNSLLAQVEESGVPVMITKHGRPVAVLGPVVSRPRTFGQLRTLTVPDSFDVQLSDAELDTWEGTP